MRPKIEITDEMVQKLMNIVLGTNRDIPWTKAYYRGGLESILGGARRMGERRAGLLHYARRSGDWDDVYPKAASYDASEDGIIPQRQVSQPQ